MAKRSSSKPPQRKAVKKAPAKKKVAKKAPAKKAASKKKASKKASQKKTTRKKTPAKKKARVKRKAPPKKKAAPKNVAEVAQQPERKKPGKPHPPTSSFEPPEGGTNDYLRMLAGAHYTTSQQGTSTEAMSKNPLFSSVSLATLQRWCADDKWVDRRKEVMDGWRRGIEQRIGSELVRNMAADLKRLRSVYDRVLKKIEEDAAKPRSLEGLVMALDKVARLMLDWSEKVAAEMVPDAPAQAEAPMAMTMGHSVRPSITPREAQRAARTILEERLRARTAQAAREESVDGPPKLEVVVDGGELG